MPGTIQGGSTQGGSVQSALINAGVGWLIDNVLGTRPLGTLAGLALGLFKMDPEAMNKAYSQVRATYGDKVKQHAGFDMPESLFGGATAQNKTANPTQAATNAAALQKATGFDWKKALLVGGGAVLGLNILGNAANTIFTLPWMLPMMMNRGMNPMAMAGGMVPGMGLGPGRSYMSPIPGGGIIPLALMAVLGFRAFRALC